MAQPWRAKQHQDDLEARWLKLFEMPLAKVQYLARPPPDPEPGGKAIYYIAGAKKRPV